MPAPTEAQQFVLEQAYRAFEHDGEWPLVVALQRDVAAAERGVDVRFELGEMPVLALVDGDRVVVLLPGLSLLAEARPLLADVMRVVRLAVERFEAQGTDATVVSGDLRELGMDDRRARLVAQVLLRDGWLFSGGHGGPGDPAWSRSVHESVWRARTAESVEDYLAVRRGTWSVPELTTAPVSLSLDLGSAGEPFALALGDAPIGETEEDELDRARLVSALADDALRPPADEGLVIALTGPWGVGKTSLLNLLEAELTAGDDAVVLRFDPWLFSSTEELVQRFLREMSAELRDAAGTTGRARRAIAEVADRVGEYAAVLEPLTAVPVVGRAVASAGILARVVAAWRKLRASPGPPALAARQRVREALRPLPHRIVVLIDDLDRLPADEIQEVMRLVTLVGDLPNVTYVLAYDRVRVEAALSERYGNGGEFLQKVVQVSHDVPAPSPDRLLRLLTAGIRRVLRGNAHLAVDGRDWARLLGSGFPRLFGNVRHVRRFLNALPATLTMVGYDVAVVDVLGLEAIRLVEPGVHERLPGAIGVLAGDSLSLGPRDDQQVHAHVRELLAGVAPEREWAVRGTLAALFPAVRTHLLGTPAGPQAPAGGTHDGAVAQAQTLALYLRRTLSPGELAAAAIRRVLDAIGDQPQLVDVLAGLTVRQAEAVLLGVADNVESLVPEQAMDVLVALTNAVEQAYDRAAYRSASTWGLALLQESLLARLPRDDARAALVAACERIASPSARYELIQSQAHRVDGRLVDELERSLVRELMRADTRVLAGERRLEDLLRLLLAADGAPDHGAHARGLLASDALFRALAVAIHRRLEADGLVASEVADRTVRELSTFGEDSVPARLDDVRYHGTAETIPMLFALADAAWRRR
ncbi:MAG TPA: P-loop NTPase fold protein [Conexibacter sp.]|jgi:hypothetical protein|nr:P-loop NTPase fold protein [Conexibacter sp.]